jgi:hypothetical protein
MKKPFRGDQLTIRYEGAVLKARCDEIADSPARGPGGASFTIVSQSPFVRGRGAQLIRGTDELAIQVERVSVVGHRRLNIVLFGGLFEIQVPALSPATSAQPPIPSNRAPAEPLEK